MFSLYILYVCLCVSEWERDLPLTKTHRIYFKVIELENTSNNTVSMFYMSKIPSHFLWDLSFQRSASQRLWVLLRVTCSRYAKSIGTTRVLCDTGRITKWSYSKKCLLKFRRNFSDFRVYKRIRSAQNWRCFSIKNLFWQQANKQKTRHNWKKYGQNWF